MTKVKVFAGACGFNSVIKVNKLDQAHVVVKVVSACRHMQSLNGSELENLSWREGIFCEVCDSKIYKLASRCSTHADCPCIPAIVKGIQVEIGAAVPKGAQIVITRNDDGTD